MTTPEATVPLALYDFVPVLLAGAGCFVLARFVRERAPRAAWSAVIAAVLVLSGGLAKAVWKLAFAAGWGNWELLESALFALLAPGFVLLAWSLLAVLGRAVPVTLPIGLVLAVEAAAFASVLHTADLREGIAAFRERRRPQFCGR